MPKTQDNNEVLVDKTTKLLKTESDIVIVPPRVWVALSGWY